MYQATHPPTSTGRDHSPHTPLHGASATARDLKAMGKKGKKKSKAQKKSGKHKQPSHHYRHHLQQPPSVAAYRSSTSPPQYPAPFPHSSKLPLPPNDGFVRDNGNYHKAYAKALDTSYEGFVYDDPDVKVSDGALFPHQKIRDALETMEKANLFRTDVTQPFGLGTKCAKTYLTRCLLGEPGTTYKYLGLRMFAHPWNSNILVSDNKSLRDALHTISDLNGTLTRRTETHLSILDEKRKARGIPQPTIKGRAKFDITLINRMETSPDLKAEPMTNKGRCTVSWHADSSLEHYSTIGVYHTIFNNKNAKDEQDGWSVALRVAHDSEGPGASRRGTDIGSSVITDTPVISTSLPSGAAYYMLDDFNHHHQHAVLAPETSSGGIRFSSTHRLLRLGHNVDFVIERCRSTCAGFHRKGPKVWRSEQMLLTDTESEWIRQFYVQGYGHKSNLWPYWKDPMCTLLKYWSQLERRTKQVVDLLRFAAEERCGLGGFNTASASVPSRAERKVREKRRKAASAISDIMDRNDDDSQDAHDAIYVPVTDLLEERATMRKLWAERERDKVFQRMDYEYRPLPPPFTFESTEVAPSDKPLGEEEEETGRSPLVGSPDDLHALAANLRQWALAYRTQNMSDLPECAEEQTDEGGDNHSKGLSWEGWSLSDKQFGLEMQKPWAGALLSGEKKIETRAYDFPPALVGKKILILESKPGKAGVSSLGNVITDSDGIDNYVRILGWAIFDQVIEYKNRESFENDEKLHLVTRDSGYGWKDGKTEVIYGWVCKNMKVYSGRDAEPQVDALVRRMRSLYQIQPKRTETAGGSPSQVGGSSSNKSYGKKNKNKKRKKQGFSASGGGGGQGASQQEHVSGKKEKKKKRF